MLLVRGLVDRLDVIVRHAEQPVIVADHQHLARLMRALRRRLPDAKKISSTRE